MTQNPVGQNQNPDPATVAPGDLKSVTQRLGPIWIASDHAGYDLKSELIAQWRTKFKYLNPLIDLGTESTASVDYPDYAQKLIVARAMEDEKTPLQERNKTPIRWSEPFGILICGSGQGMAIKANRDARVRAALCWDVEIARVARAHNDANVLCLSSRNTPHELAAKMVQMFFNAPFEGGRHERRVLKL